MPTKATKTTKSTTADKATVGDSTAATKVKTKGYGLSIVALVISIISLISSTAFVVVALALGAAGSVLGKIPFSVSLDSDGNVSISSGTDSNSANFTEGSIAEIAHKVSPSVVSIVTETRTSGWFGQSSTSTSAGTGMIVTSDGYVLTNKHVIEGARRISIVTDTGTTYSSVKLVGTDPIADVAYLKIADVKDLPAVTLGNSNTISVGQQVIAIGNALGQYQNTITAGVISGTGRSLTACSDSYCSDSEYLSDMIQTDAAINAGNSGGPLVNAAGEVIGINTATSANADNIGFAIPISSVKGMLKNIIENGKAERAYIGVRSVALTPDIASKYKLPLSTGAYVISSSSAAAVEKNSPADKAGLKAEDIITRVGNTAVGKVGSLSTLIGEYMPGDTIKLTVRRGDKDITLDVTLGSFPKN